MTTRRSVLATAIAVIGGCATSPRGPVAEQAAWRLPAAFRAPGLFGEDTQFCSRRHPDEAALSGAQTAVWEYRLVITETTHRLADGTPYKVFAYGNQVPAPTLVAREGDRIRILLVNETTVPHTIHSHGLFTPQRMDGATHVHVDGHGHAHAHDAPGAPKPVQPGEEFLYDYIARPSGTHFYHCHVSANEHLARGMLGSLVVFPREPEPPVDMDTVFLLQEWNSRYAKSGKPGHPRETGDMDFFTLNGLSFPNTPLLSVPLGARVRLRLVNGGAQPHFMHLHGHSFLVTHKDGLPLREPALMDTVPVGPAERADIFFVANNPGDWPMHCHSPPHTTNAGEYPGGMMLHLVVGKDRYPVTGEGPVGPGTEASVEEWRANARRWFARHARAGAAA